jgi:ArsR family transcriptional regulator, arsenate/arsenite/antimonite-responsive transcriptional repressor
MLKISYLARCYSHTPTFTRVVCLNLSFILYKYFRIFVRNLTNDMMTTEKVITEKQEKTARYAKAMGHPVRMYVLELLSTQNCCYSGDLSEELPIAKSTLSQHLKELKEAGLIQGEIEAPRIKYCINKDNWKEAQILFKEFLRI